MEMGRVVLSPEMELLAVLVMSRSGRGDVPDMGQSREIGCDTGDPTEVGVDRNFGR